MLYKTLKHKKLPDTFGVWPNDRKPLTDFNLENESIPDLFAEKVTIDYLKRYGRMKNLDDYDLVDVEVIIKS